jgi:hypothetical protein
MLHDVGHLLVMDLTINFGDCTNFFLWILFWLAAFKSLREIFLSFNFLFYSIHRPLLPSLMRLCGFHDIARNILAVYISSAVQRFTESLRCHLDAEGIFQWNRKIQHGFKLISSRSATNIQDVVSKFSLRWHLLVLTVSIGSGSNPKQRIGLCTSAMLLRRFKLAADLGISPNPL